MNEIKDAKNADELLAYLKSIWVTGMIFQNTDVRDAIFAILEMIAELQEKKED